MKKRSLSFYKAKNGQWAWRLCAANGRVICTPNETFVSPRNVVQSYWRVALWFESKTVVLVAPPVVRKVLDRGAPPELKSRKK